MSTFQLKRNQLYTYDRTWLGWRLADKRAFMLGPQVCKPCNIKRERATWGYVCVYVWCVRVYIYVYIYIYICMYVTTTAKEEPGGMYVCMDGVYVCVYLCL